MNITFEDFVRTRHAMWLEKTYGTPIETYLEDLTAYELMRGHRYTNIWRELDRGTLEMIRYQSKYQTHGLQVAVFHTLLYRFFNSEQGYMRYLRAVVDAGEMIDNPSAETINAVLDRAGNFSGAYIRTVKRSIAVHALQTMWDHAVNIAAEISMHAVNPTDLTRDLVRSAFGAVPSFGDFLADQLMLDFCWQGNPWGLRFTPGLGPGAMRGMKRAGLTFADAIDAGQRGLAGMPVPKFWNVDACRFDAVVFDAAAAEHQLCEAEKLWKIIDAAEEGAGRQVKMRTYAEKNMRVPMTEPLPQGWMM